MIESAASAPRIALLTQQVTHYHAARYRAAHRRLPGLRVISLVNSADFDGMLSSESDLPDTVRLFNGEADYARAVSSGTLWKRVQAELDAHRPEVVVVAGWSFPESLAAIEWATHSGARAVLMSDSQARDAARSRFRETIKSRIVRACDAALVAAGPQADYAAQLGITRERIFYGYDVVDNDHFARGSEAARAHADAVRSAMDLPPRYLIACGRLVAKKNFPGLVDAFAAALEGGVADFHLVILGDGPERASIEAVAARHGIKERVHLPGFRAYQDLPALYGLASGFVHVAIAEQWGLVVSEAAASALPLVVSNPCGAAVLVEEGMNGFIVDPADRSGIADRLRKLMTLPDAGLRAMGAASRLIVADWGPERHAEGLRLACEAALARPARRLGLADQLLFRALSRMRTSKVQ